ncbi:MAG: hypothetical protein UT09_C0018G0013 [Parcubacteria group bacterium GW2011_GWF2_38_8]|nr:MAG: hypothetical protein UT09_C0018G0013 [Parcubacteria group bacterium GW2011_GWF2_38_8]
MEENPFNKEQLRIVIEIAKPEDWEDYKKIRLEAIKKESMAFYVTKSSKEKEYGKSEKDWKKDLIGHNTFVVLTKNKDIPVGMAHALLRAKGDGLSEWAVRSVYLNKDFRERGFGKKIIKLILDEIKNRGGKDVTLNVADTQEIAKGVYEKLGFKVLVKFEPEEEDGTMWPGGYWMKKEI